MARRYADVEPTVNGGLTFFGAPLNTYMTHAACAMVRGLRNGAKLGLLYGQGGFVTKHHALVLSRQPPPEPLAQNSSVQAEANHHRGPVPEFVAEAKGAGLVESFTVTVRSSTARTSIPSALARVAGDHRTLAHFRHGSHAVDRRARLSPVLTAFWNGRSRKSTVTTVPSAIAFSSEAGHRFA